MSTKAFETTDPRGAHLDARAPVQTYRVVVPPVLELNGAVCHILAALNATSVGFTNNRLKENFTLPEQMASCTSVPAMLRVYGGYCRTAIEQYQSAVRQFQRIGLDLLGEVPATGLVPVKISELQHEHTAHSPGAHHARRFTVGGPAHDSAWRAVERSRSPRAPSLPPPRQTVLPHSPGGSHATGARRSAKPREHSRVQRRSSSASESEPGEKRP